MSADSGRRRVILVGSGPAAAGAALVLSERRDLHVTVIDVGVRLESEQESLRVRLSATSPNEWSAADVAGVSVTAIRAPSGGLPEKRSFGSDFPFRDVGQFENLTALDRANSRAISGAFGGFSNVWGAQFMPFSKATLERWPFGLGELQPHYESILKEVSLAAEEDDLADRFPLLGASGPLPPVAARTQMVLERYARHRAAVNPLGVTVGKARLAMRPQDCVRCGLCMTGCPYRLVYSAAHTFDRLIKAGRLSYRPGWLAIELQEDAERATVIARSVRSGELHRFEADRVFVACGPIGTTRLVMGSLGLFGEEAVLEESVQFTLPMLSRRPTSDPRNEQGFTLNQFNMVIAPDNDEANLSQLHFYTYNPAFLSAVPGPLRSPRAEPALAQLLRRTSVALGYLPSWHSPRLRLRVTRGSAATLAPGSLRREEPRWLQNQMLRSVLARVAKAGRYLDLYPVIPRLEIAAGAKSYHVGSSFPHGGRPDRPRELSSDRQGRVGPWRRIHLIDGSVFPNVPATTFTFTVMANAHRIATEALEFES